MAKKNQRDHLINDWKYQAQIQQQQQKRSTIFKIEFGRENANTMKICHLRQSKKCNQSK